MKYLLFLPIILLLSCSTTALFKEIDTRVEEINNQHNNIIKWKEVVKTSEKIFRKLNNQLRNSDHYIYIYTLEYKSMFISDGSFHKGMIYDVNSKKKYYIYIKKKNYASA